MKIGVFNHGWWKPACEALALESVDLPIADGNGNAYATDLASRITAGTAVHSNSDAANVDFWLDNGGTGLSFIPGAGADAQLQLAHEAAGKVLCSHFIDPLVTAFQSLDWNIIYQALQSPNWLKLVWDRAHVGELGRMGVGNVVHMPMAAPDRPYDTRPLDAAKCDPIVSFVGGQNTTFFSTGNQLPAPALVAGTLTSAIRSDLPDVLFHDAYHDVYGLGEPVQESDDLGTRVNKIVTYFSAKLFFCASLCLRNRDRFVIHMKRQLGDTFRLIGGGWDTAYGLSAEPQIPGADAYFEHFRQSAINISLISGNAETGINMRHYEITAAGGFLMCYDQPELAEHFAVGKECVVFHNERDLIEKIKYYLARPAERAEIAAAGQRRTLSHHLHSHRLQSLLDMITPRPLPVEYSTTTWSDDLKSLVPEPDVVLDCGANIGQTTRSLRNMYPRATIHCFEPVRACRDKLRSACDEVGAHPVFKAVSDHDGTERIHLTTSPECNSLLGYQDGNPAAKWTWVVGEEQIEVCTLDRWCGENDIDPSRVDIIKLDVQGAELKALYGARNLLKTVRAVYAEVSFVPIYKDCPLFEEFDSFMTECGYRRAAIYPSDQPHNWGDALYIKTERNT